MHAHAVLHQPTHNQITTINLKIFNINNKKKKKDFIIIIIIIIKHQLIFE